MDSREILTSVASVDGGPKAPAQRQDGPALGFTWFVARAQERRERYVAQNLERQGFSAYVPTLLTRRKRLGRWLDWPEAIFPGYLFVGARSYSISGRSVVTQNISPVRSTRGVVGLVRFGLVFAVMPGTAIEELRQREAAGRSGMIEDPRRKFSQGEHVSIRTGTFAGMQGIYHQRDGKKRVIVLLGYLDQVRSVSLPIDWIEKT